MVINTIKNMNQNKQFSLICYLILMQNINQTSPDYIMEKFNRVSEDVEYAFSSLDHINQGKVIDYCNKWNVKIPKIVDEYISDCSKLYK